MASLGVAAWQLRGAQAAAAPPLSRRPALVFSADSGNVAGRLAAVVHQRRRRGDAREDVVRGGQSCHEGRDHALSQRADISPEVVLKYVRRVAGIILSLHGLGLMRLELAIEVVML